MLANVWHISGRRTIMSIAPFSIRNSLRWKPGGSFSHGLLDDARAGKADQRFRLGDVDVAQHRQAGGNAAHGRSVSTEMYGKPALLHLGQRRAGFAICISDISASCMRAPPLAEKLTQRTVVLQRLLNRTHGTRRPRKTSSRR